jgi:hypothetical protein
MLSTDAPLHKQYMIKQDYLIEQLLQRTQRAVVQRFPSHRLSVYYVSYMYLCVLRMIENCIKLFHNWNLGCQKG